MKAGKIETDRTEPKGAAVDQMVLDTVQVPTMSIEMVVGHADLDSADAQSYRPMPTLCCLPAHFAADEEMDILVADSQQELGQE